MPRKGAHAKVSDLDLDLDRIVRYVVQTWPSQPTRLKLDVEHAARVLSTDTIVQLKADTQYEVFVIVHEVKPPTTTGGVT